MPQPQPERLAYTLYETADLVGPVSIRTVYNWIKRDGLKVVKIGGKPMILRDDLNDFIARCRNAEAA